MNVEDCVLDRLSGEAPIRAALARDDPAVVELIWDRYARDLFAFLQAALRSKHDAEDALQAVFVKIVRKRRYLARARCLDAYVFQIARNEIATALRRRRRRPADARVDTWLVADAGHQGTELTEELQTALAQLPPAQREVVVMKVYGDRTFQEIAKTLDLSQHTVASRYRYAMEKLRALLKDFLT